MDNLLPLEQWRKLINYNPFHFWQLTGSRAPVSSACNTAVLKYSWHGADAAGRVDILDAIMTAEQRIMPYLGYAPAPHWSSVTLPFPHFPKDDLMRIGYAGSDNRWISVRLPEGMAISLGVEATSVIQAGATVVQFDNDGDGLFESFTVTVPAGTLTDPSQVAVYYAAVDRLDGDGINETWRIAPLDIKLVGANFVIRGKIWQIVKPTLYETYAPQTQGLDASVATNYVPTLDVYRRYTNVNGTSVDDAQALLIWESSPFPQWACITPGTLPDPSSQAYAIARCVIRDADAGIIGLGESYYDATTGNWYAVPWFASPYRFQPPDRVIIRYKAGFPADTRLNGAMDSRMAMIIARAATAELQRRICACDEANREIYHWQFDLARTGGAAGESYGAISGEDLNNPLGTRRGQVFAWKEIKNNRILKGFSAG
jgi:hypothetical protein